MILVIIDMQERFNTSFNEKTLKACRREIETAKLNKYPILFVEFGWHYNDLIKPSPTQGLLTEAVEEYDLVATVIKHYDNGSAGIIKGIFENNFSSHNDKLLICGVNADACVKQTVDGLKEKNFSMVAVADAINCGDAYNNTGLPHGEHVLGYIREYQIPIIRETELLYV